MAEAEDKAAPGATSTRPGPPLHRTSSVMNVSNLQAKVEPKTELDKLILQRIVDADVNKDGTLSRDEIISVVKDLVLETKSRVRYSLISLVVTALLIASLVANFGLVIWANEVSKESHVTSMTEAPAPSSPSTTTSTLALENAVHNQPALTADNSNNIVATASAVVTVPIEAANLMELTSSGEPIKLTFDKVSRSGRPSGSSHGRRRRLEQEDELPRHSVEVEVKSVERVTATHVVYKIDECSEVHYKDGDTKLHSKCEQLSDIVNTPLLTGGSHTPEDSETLEGVVTTESNANVSFTAEDYMLGTTTFVEKVCSCEVTVGATSTKEGEEVDAYVEESERLLAERGVDHGTLRARRQRRLQTTAEPDEESDCDDLDPGYYTQSIGDAVATTMADKYDAAACQNDDNLDCACGRTSLTCHGILIIHEGALEEDMNKIETEEHEEHEEQERRRRARKLQDEEEGEQTEKSTTLFVTKKAGAKPIESSPTNSDTSTTETVYFEVGICGAKCAKTDPEAKCATMSFKPCGSDTWSASVGQEARKRSKVQDASEGEVEPAFKRGPSGRRKMTAKAKARKARELSDHGEEDEREQVGGDIVGNEDLVYEDVYESADNTAITGVIIHSGSGDKVHGVQFTTATDTVGGKTVASEEQLSPIIGSSGTHRYPNSEQEDEEETEGRTAVATTGTRAVGAIVESNDDGVKSLTFIYKDDCQEDAGMESEYKSCRNEVKQLVQTGSSDEEIKRRVEERRRRRRAL